MACKSNFGPITPYFVVMALQRLTILQFLDFLKNFLHFLKYFKIKTSQAGRIKKYTKGFEVLLFDVARTTQKSKRKEEKKTEQR